MRDNHAIYFNFTDKNLTKTAHFQEPSVALT
jgi:hypothetical protein